MAEATTQGGSEAEVLAPEESGHFSAESMNQAEVSAAPDYAPVSNGQLSTRRGFLRTAALAVVAGGLALAGRPASVNAQEPDKSEQTAANTEVENAGADASVPDAVVSDGDVEDDSGYLPAEELEQESDTYEETTTKTGETTKQGTTKPRNAELARAYERVRQEGLRRIKKKQNYTLHFQRPSGMYERLYILFEEKEEAILCLTYAGDGKVVHPEKFRIDAFSTLLDGRIRRNLPVVELD